MTKVKFFDFFHPAVPFIWAYFFFLLFSFLFVPIDELFSILVPFEVALSLAIYLVTFLCSCYIFSNFLVPPPKNPGSIIYDVNPKAGILISGLFFIIATVIYLFVYIKIGFLPVLEPDAESLRVEAKKGLGYFYLMGSAILYVVNIFNFTFWGFYSRFNKALIVVVLLLSFLLILGLGYRGPALMVFLAAGFARFFLNDGFFQYKKVRLRFWLLGIFMLFLLTIIGAYRHGGHISFGLIYGFLWITTVNLSNLVDIVNYFDVHDYRYFSTVVNDFLVAVPGVSSQFFGNELKDLLTMNFEGEGVTVTAPGEGYANLGFFGVFIHALFLGLITGTSYNVLMKGRRVSRLMLLMIVTLNLWRVVAGGFMPMLIFSLAPTLFIYILFLAILKRGKI